jgi:ribose transport system substrate-binding protein
MGIRTAAALMAAALVAAGCGGSDSDGAASGGGGQKSGSAAGAKEAAAKVADAKKLPKFVAPGDPVDMASTKGKTVWILTSTQAVPFVANIAKGAAEAAQTAGWSTRTFDGKGNVTEWNRVLSQAVAQKVDGVITVGASPEVMKPAMAKAAAAKIPVVDAITADKTAPLVPGTFSHVSISFVDSGRLQADYVVAHAKDGAGVLVFGDNEFPGEVSRVQGMKEEFGKLCPSCKVTVRDTQVAKIGTELGPLAQTLLRKDPSIAWVLPTYDAQGLNILPAIKQAGLTDKVKVVGANAVPDNLDSVAKNDVQVADVGEPAFWSGWAAVDEIARAFTGGQPVDENIPLRLFDSGNLGGVDTSDEDSLFGGSFRDEYKKLWGLT